ncbi:ribosomal protein S5-alanine N-acetyltransferase [Vibrio hannami]|uniref:ribosomal protein S5-alanine N-acetyltransferase n=1 Tax=Vibrio hannami TaxID=2717094 RepID=UPI00240F0E46|nr:ribosomal protein S5-alanine N-acetyltransferase [Vibrio hannami]MDG3088191.1 ribosomal protein S5-alanine N-acetyltransferase [Vibrio hannami]
MWRDIKVNRMHEEFDGVVVRLAEKDDAKRISEYFIKNREYLAPWEPHREEDFYTQYGWAKKLIKLCELHLLGIGFYCLILDKESGNMLGTISFSNITRFPLHGCFVGYSLDQHAQGKGIMRKALKRACNWMFKTQNMHRISASYMPSNQKSAAVLASVGFEEEGFAKDYLLIKGKWEDHKLTSLINSKWLEKK